MTLCDTDLICKPNRCPPLSLDRVLQVGSGEKASPHIIASHDTNISPSDTLRKYYFGMRQNDRQPVKFGPWLEAQIRHRRWNQSEFARRVGVKPGVVSHWVRGQRLPTPASIDRIADVLVLDVDDVLALAGHRPPGVSIDPDSPTARLMPLIEAVEWGNRPERLASLEFELRQMIEWDRMRKNEDG